MRGSCVLLFSGSVLLLAACATSFTLIASSPAAPWAPGELMSAASLASSMGKPAPAGSTPQPLVVQVGFRSLYHGAHIAGSIYAGPASTAEGIEILKRAVEREPRDREIVLYCGCCPWDHCPNIRPAFAVLKQMGFAHVRAVEIPQNLKTDWLDHGYPTAHGDAP